LESKWRLNVSTEGWSDGTALRIARCLPPELAGQWLVKFSNGASARVFFTVHPDGRMQMTNFSGESESWAHLVNIGMIEPD
jgi:hypothetical protein